MSNRLAMAWPVVLGLAVMTPGALLGEQLRGALPLLAEPAVPDQEWLTAAPTVTAPQAAPWAEAAPPVQVPADDTFHQGDLRFRLGGQYRVLPNFSNFFFQSPTISDNQPTENFANQRLRLWLTVMPNDNVEGYVQMQVGGFLWGQNFEFPKTFNGPIFSALGIPPHGDRVGIMLRRAWLGYKDDEYGRFRIGILDWHDSFGDTLASSDYEFDVAGVDWVKEFPEFGKLRLWLGAFVLTDEALLTDSTDIAGAHDAYLFTLDADQPLGSCYSIGGSIYYLADHGQYSYPTNVPYRSSWDLWLGLRARAKWDPVPVNAFVIYNPGQRDDLDGTEFRHNGWAAKVEAGPVAVGPGKLSAQVLWASGDSNPGTGSSDEFRTIAQTYRDNFGAQGYWSYLYLTSPNGPADVKDLGVSLQNRGYGLFTIQTKYEYPICHRLSGITAFGYLWADSANVISGSKDIGPELAQQFTFDFGGGLKADFGVAVLFTGDFYRASPVAPEPNTLYEVFCRVQLEF
jgi:hypothetical protein